MELKSSATGEIDTFVFLTPRQASYYEQKKWSLDYIRSQGYSVVVIDFEKLHYGKYCPRLVREPLVGDDFYHVSTYSEFESLVQKLANHSIFVDYLVSHSDVSLKWERVFRILKRNNADYIILSSGALPHPLKKLNWVTVFKRNLIKSVLSPQLLLDFLVSRIILLFTRYGILYPLPIMIFGGNSETLLSFIANRHIEKNKVIPINSFDYDEALRFERANVENLDNDHICVFLDEAATHHSDFILTKTRPADDAVYFYEMNHLFDFIEHELGMKVVVAAHPRSNYKSMPDVFEGREIFFDKTVDLVFKSKLVVMHASTSVSYAILFNKPVVIVKIPGVGDAYPINIMAECLSNEIGCNFTSANLERFDVSTFKQQINDEKYLEYKKRYIKTDGAGDKAEWEIVVDAIRCL